MVFESVVTDLLNRILGDYVQNLDSKQLKIGIWGGDVVLNNLVLKHSALDDLKLPVQIKYGSLGKLVLKIPWSNLYGASCECLLESLYLVVVPNSEVIYNEEKEIKWAFESKQAELERIERAKKNAEKPEDQKKVDDSFVEKLTTQIIKNVQVKIKNIHIRYEDKITNPTHPFCLGITLSNLSIISTDSGWRPAIVQDAVAKIYKELELEGLAVYWNSDSVLYSNLSSEELERKLQDGIASKTMIPDNYIYMLGPINSNARLQLNPKPEHDKVKFSIPKLVLNFEMEKLAIGVSKVQYRDVMLLVDSMERMSKATVYRKYRPSVPRQGHAKEWWKFAYTCIVEEEIKRKRNNWDWNHMIEHRHICQEYAQVYHQKLTTKKLPKEIAAKVDEYEHTLDIVNIVIIRQKIAFEVERLGRIAEERKKTQTWLSGWWGGSGSADDDAASANSIMRQFQDAMTPDEKKRLFSAIGYQENTAPTEYPVTFVGAICKFNLKALRIEIKDDSLAVPKVLNLDIADVKCCVENRPAASALKVVVTVHKMTAHGLKQGEIVPEMISSTTEGVSLLDVLFEKNPLDEACNQRVHVTANPLKIVYNAATVIKLVEIFKTPDEISSDFSQLAAAAGSQLDNFKQFSNVGLQYMISQHNILDLKVFLHAPYIIVPYNGLYTQNESVLVVNLGKMEISTIPRNLHYKTVKEMFDEGYDEERINKTMIEQSYDKFILQFTDLQMMVATETEPWKESMHGSDVTSMHLLKPVSLNIELHKSVILDDPRLPKMKVIGCMDSLDLCFSDARILLLLALVNSIPLPSDDVPQPHGMMKRDSLSKLSTLSMSSAKLAFSQRPSKISIQKCNVSEANSSTNVVELTNMCLKFELKVLSVVLQYQPVLTESAMPFIAFQMNAVKAEIKQKTFTMDVSLSLGDTNLTQQVAGRKISLIDTPRLADTEADDLFSVSYVQVDKKSPQFRTKYQSVKQCIHVDFKTLQVLLHQESLVQIIFHVEDFKKKIAKFHTAAAADRVAGGKSNFPDLNLDKMKMPKKSRLKKQQTSDIDVKLVANIREVIVLIENDRRPLASLAVKGLNTDIVVTPAYTCINMSLVNLAVIDLNKNTIHKYILTQNSSEAMNLMCMMYNLEDFPDVSDVDIKVKLSVGGLRIMFLNWFITSFLDFLAQFQMAQQMIIEASQAAAQSAKENLAKAYEKAVKIDLHIIVKAPDVIMPLNSYSKQAMLLDLGFITLTNHFLLVDVEGSAHQAVIDEMEMTLKKLKLSTIVLDDAGDEGFVSETVLLRPVTFDLDIKRNLSKGWYKNVPDIDMSGQIDLFNIAMAQDDYHLLLRILEENMKEGAAEAKPAVTPKRRPIDATPTLETDSDTDLLGVSTLTVGSMSAKKTDMILEKLEVQLEEAEDEEVAQGDKVYITIKFTFTMNNLIIDLFHSNPNPKLPSHTSELGLARFSLEVLSVKGRILSDNTITTSLVLVNFLMDDTRAGRKNMLTRYLQRKMVASDPSTEKSEDYSVKSMIDLTFQQKDLDKFIDCRVSSFQLILAMDYLMLIATFFTGGLEKLTSDVSAEPSPTATAVSSQTNVVKSVPLQGSKQSSETQVDKSSMSLNLKVEKPDIILIEHMSVDDTNALTLNGEVLMKLRAHGAHTILNGTVTDFQLNVCLHSSKGLSDKVCSVLYPLTVSVAGSTPLGQGLHVEIIFTDIRLGMSPTTIELLSNIYDKTMESTRKKVEDVSLKDETYEDIWTEHELNTCDYWFLRTEAGEEALDMTAVVTPVGSRTHAKPLNELCILTMPSIVVTCEAGVGNKTLPMLMLQSSFQGSVNNWSSEMKVDAMLSLQVGCYNSRLALWEPLIEPVEKTLVKSDMASHQPWEIRFLMQMNSQDEFVGTPMSPSDGTESIDEIQFQQPAMSIDISSTVNLEITVTKTSLEVLNNLGKAFSSAIREGTMKRIDAVAPYIVRNDCGLPITVLLNSGAFALYEPESPETIVLEGGARVDLQLTRDRNMSTSGLLNATVNASGMLHTEQMLCVNIDEVKAKLFLPVYRADKRYFSLNHRGDNKDMWGLISDISVEGGSLLVVLRSILKVYNHLKEPVELYYMTSRGNELESIAIIEPGNSYNLPLKAVYTPTAELFFSVAGYSVTASPFVWKDLQLNLSVAKLLQCSPKNPVNNSEPFIMKVVGEIEQVYNENTIRHTMASTCYNIHLRTAVVLKNCLPVKITCMIQNSTEEKTVEPGFTLQLPNVDPGKSSIVIRIPEYLEKDWSCKHEIPLTPGQFGVWQFDSYDSAAKMSMDLGMHNENKNGTIELTLYCPNWMLNKTGLLLAYRSSEEHQNVLYHPPDVKTPILFSYNAKNFLGKKKAAIRIDQGEWSDKFSLDVAGSAGVVACKANDMLYQIGVSNQLTYNGLTKQITFTPYFVIINNCQFAIESQELERSGDPWTRVEPDCCAALWPKSQQDDKLIKLRVCGTAEITAPFLYTEMHTTLLKLKNQYGGINVDVQMTEGSVYIVLTSYLPGMAPVLIMNNTCYAMKFWEKESVVIKNVSSNHSMLFTWDNPAGSRLLLWDTGCKKELQDDLRKDGVGNFSPTDDYMVFWVSFLDGMQRVLLFTSDPTIAEGAQTAGELEAMQQEITLSIHGVGLSFVNNLTRLEIMYIGIAGSGVIWETCKKSSKRYKQMSVRDSALMEAAYQQYLLTIVDESEAANSVSKIVLIDGKMEVDFETGLLLKPNEKRIRRDCQTGLWLQIKSSPHQMQLHAKIHRLQIDNQMFDCIFPVVLAPVPPPKSVAINSVLKPFAELSIVQRLMKHSNIKQYKYYKVLIQEFHIKVDLGFVNAVLELLRGSEETEQEATQRFHEDLELMNKPLLAHVSSQSVQEQKNFYDLLHFSPLKIHVSFSLASGHGASSTGAQGTTPPFLNVLLQGVGVTLTDLQDVVFRLAYFQHEYTFLTQRQLISEAKSHYVGQAIKQLYVLVLGLDVLGNPYGLVVGFTKGVEDLFYEPFQGAIQGPGEFAEGLVLGVRSLFGHTVGGAAGAVSRITGAMGKGIAALTFDKDYQRKRRDQQKKRPANIQEEIARSGKGLVMGVVDGVTGVFTKPISGAKEQGVEGFFKGLGKGAVGLVTRPTAGVIDFASGSFDFVKRATEVGEETNRLRPPRFLPGDGMVKAFIRWEAHGNKLLAELEKGKYANTDIYAFHVSIVENKDYLLMTDKRIAYVVRNDIFGGWQTDWSYTWQEVQSPAKVVPKGVAITAGETKKKVLGLFGSSETGKIVLIGDNSLKERVCAKIEELRKNA